MKSLSPTRATAIVVSLSLAGLLSGALTGVAAVARAQDPYSHLDLFARVLTTIERHYVDEVSSEALVEAAIEGMVDHLDSQSRWLSAKQLNSLKDETLGESTGLGVDVHWMGERLTVTKVYPDSSAHRQGIRVGDVLIAVDEQPLEGMSLGSVRGLLTGERGSSARIRIERPASGTTTEVTATMDEVQTSSVTSERIDNLIYARITQFQRGTGTELSLALERHLEALGGAEACGGLILDLRDNPGGLLGEAVAVSDLFLREGPIVYTEDRDGGERQQHDATPSAVSDDIPVVVLVNHMSASASEIVAAALQETQRATLIGQTTWGKGTVQQVYRHDGATALKLTVGRYYTASGAPVADRRGRTPDITVEQPHLPSSVDPLIARLESAELEDELRNELLELARTVEATETELKPIRWDRSASERVQTDPTLQRALLHLRGS